MATLATFGDNNVGTGTYGLPTYDRTDANGVEWWQVNNTDVFKVYASDGTIGNVGDVIWQDVGNVAPTKFNITATTNNPGSITIGNGDPANIQANDGHYIHMFDIGNVYYGYTQISIWSTPGGGSGGGGGGSSGYPPPRTTLWMGAVGIAVSWVWRSYIIYDTATGGSAVGGMQNGGWVANLLEGDEVNEVEAEIEVGASNPNGADVNSGDQLWVKFDEEHDDTSAIPNMTVTSETIDSAGNVDNPSNTSTNVATAGATGSKLPVKIVCVRPPKGTITVVKLDSSTTPATEVVVDEVVVVPPRTRVGNFW